jgi:hypothetical protein
MIKTIKNFFQKRKHREFLVGKKIGGHTFWTFATVAAMPGERRIAFNASIAMAELGVSKDDLKACIKRIEEAASKNDMLTVIKVANLLDTYTDLYANEKITFEIANNVILLDNEDILKTDEQSTQKKRELFNNNPEIHAFFLNSLTALLQDIGLLTKGTDLKEYFNRPEVMKSEAAYLRLMQDVISKNK